MPTITDKLLSILESKEDIKDAIEEKGVEVGSAPLNEYGNKIREISGAPNNVIKRDIVEELPETPDEYTVYSLNTHENNTGEEILVSWYPSINETNYFSLDASSSKEYIINSDGDYDTDILLTVRGPLSFIPAGFSLQSGAYEGNMYLLNESQLSITSSNYKIYKLTFTLMLKDDEGQVYPLDVSHWHSDSGSLSKVGNNIVWQGDSNNIIITLSGTEAILGVLCEAQEYEEINKYEGDLIYRDEKYSALVTAENTTNINNVNLRRNTLYNEVCPETYESWTLQKWGVDRIKINDGKLRYNLGKCKVVFYGTSRYTTNNVVRVGCTSFIVTSQYPLEYINFNLASTGDTFFRASVGDLDVDDMVGEYRWTPTDIATFKVTFFATQSILAQWGIEFPMYIGYRKFPEQRALYRLNEYNVLQKCGYKLRLRVDAMKYRGIVAAWDDNLTFMLNICSGAFDIHVDGGLSPDEKIVLVLLERYKKENSYVYPAELYDSKQSAFLDVRNLYPSAVTPHGFCPRCLITTNYEGENTTIDYLNTRQIVVEYNVIPYLSLRQLSKEEYMNTGFVDTGTYWIIEEDSEVYGGTKRSSSTARPVGVEYILDNYGDNYMMPLTFENVFFDLIDSYRFANINSGTKPNCNPFYSNLPETTMLRYQNGNIVISGQNKIFGFAIWNKRTNLILEVVPFKMYNGLGGALDPDSYDDGDLYDRTAMFVDAVTADYPDINIHCKKIVHPLF